MLTDLKSILSPEEKLLLSLCRLEFSEEQRAESAEMMKGVKDWDRYLKLVNEHGIIALEAYNLRELGLADLVPGPVMKTLDNARMQALIRNSWLVKRWKEVNEILSAYNIRHVLIKGMALEYTVYGGRGLRQMNDNDILVKKDDALRSWSILQEYGFVPQMLKSPLHRKIITETGKHLPTLAKDGYAIEIHHRLFSDTKRNERLPEEIDKARQIMIAGTRAFILNKETHVDYLISHNQYHMTAGGSQLRLFLDIELLKTGSSPEIPYGFLSERYSESTEGNTRNSYIQHFHSLPAEVRLRYLTGDIFPSLNWMKKRYNCGPFKAILHYPARLGKLLWILRKLPDKQVNHFIQGIKA